MPLGLVKLTTWNGCFCLSGICGLIPWTASNILTGLSLQKSVFWARLLALKSPGRGCICDALPPFTLLRIQPAPAGSM